MRKITEIICPLSGGNLVYTGATSDDFVHFYESATNQGIRYIRYRLEWDMLELKGSEGRHFHINGNEAVEMQKVGDKWLTLNASDEDKERALTEHSKRIRHAMANMQFPMIKNAGGMDIVPVIPMDRPVGNRVFEMQYKFDMTEELIVDIDKNARPNISADDCSLVDYITGKKGLVDETNITSLKELYDTDDIQIGDTIYEWNMGGWKAMAGRSGEVIFRDDKYITSKLLKMS